MQQGPRSNSGASSSGASSRGPRHWRGALPCCSAPEALWTLASTDPSALQDLIVGGAITAAVGAALYSGLQKDPVPCDLCMGTGGIRCFACEGSGKMDAKPPGAAAAQQLRPRRDPVGRSGNPRACRVCGGTGLVLCSRCKGKGYVNPSLLPKKD